MKYIIPFILLFSLYTQHAFAEAEKSTPFAISGVVSDSSGSASIKQFVRYLRNKTNINFEIYYASNYSKLSRVLRDNPHAFGWTCGAPYVEDEKQDQQQLVSVPLFKGQPLYHSLIITAIKNSEKKLLDFKGKIFVYSDPRSNSGYLAPSVQLLEQGVEINQHFSLMINSGSHKNSIVSLLNGLADVAAIDEYIWIEYIKEHPDTLSELHEIERTGPYPFIPVVAGKDVAQTRIRKVREVLINMSNDRQGKLILKNIGMDGFVNKTTSFYQPVRDMINMVDKNTDSQR